jgi:hypothetical protein
VYSKPVGGDEQRRQGKQGELKFAPTTDDHTLYKIDTK